MNVSNVYLKKRRDGEVPRCRILAEKRARLYIIRRCLLMLLCWKETAD
ncbi:hypothetical protein PVL29_020154 [Vitis rotundifolia]|uniref:Uncharacterized protein n=1 Tax=Vitis rotundifolia TaxID=103349 RepID=A0AA39DGA9_VITRO|nr:hypothetical protein PVL29_020154 [Vitis rotundifolia]